jgi:hypothetical protein
MFVHEEKYTKDFMKKFNMAELKLVSTPMSTTKMLHPDENCEAVDQREYRSMIDSLLYLTTTWPNFSSLCAYAHVFKLPHPLYIEQSFSGFSGISNTHSNWGFGIPRLHHLILLAFLMPILRVVELIKKHLWHMSVSWIFSYLLVFSQTIFCCIIHHRG